MFQFDDTNQEMRTFETTTTTRVQAGTSQRQEILEIVELTDSDDDNYNLHPIQINTHWTQDKYEKVTLQIQRTSPTMNLQQYGTLKKIEHKTLTSLQPRAWINDDTIDKMINLFPKQYPTKFRF